MKGQNWDGKPVDCRENLRPVTDALLYRQQGLGLSGRAVSAMIRSGNWHSLLISTLHNPSVGRLAMWASLIQAQEFGLFLCGDDGYAEYPIYDMDVPPPWTERPGKVPKIGLRTVLGPFGEAMSLQRKHHYKSIRILAEHTILSRSTIASLEGGDGLRNPTLGRLTEWARFARAEEFGVYVIIGGAFTEANMLEAPHG